MVKLTDRAIRALGAGRHADGGKLYLLVKEAGGRSWVFRYLRHDKRVDLGLGSWPDVSLAAARAKAAELRAMLAAGGDPKAARQKPAIPTFEEAAAAYIDENRAAWRSEIHARQWRVSLATHAAKLNPLRVDKIDVADVLKVLKPIWVSTPETASRVRGRIESILDAAIARGHRTAANPARWKGGLAHILPRPAETEQRHHPAMHWGDVPALMRELADRETIVADALRFAILTAARRGEVLGAVWSEIDLAGGLWAVPADRMKPGRAHVVPLNGPAIAVLERMQRLAGGPDSPVFQSRTGRALSHDGMRKLLARLRPGVSIHGFRTSFRVWAAEETDFAGDLAEMALSHTVGSAVTRAYQRSNLIVKRRLLMDAWGAFATGTPRGNVVALRAAQ